MLFASYLLVIGFIGGVLAAPPSLDPPKRILHTDAQIDELIVSGDSKTIYVAAVNQLISVSNPDLNIISNLSIGPVLDSPWCSSDGRSCLKDHRPFPTDVHSKILTILPNGHLLHCTSVKLGSCAFYSSTLRHLSTIATPVVANSAEASTVSLIVDNHLIVAASPTKESPYRDPFPSVAMRSLPALTIENVGDLEGEAAVFLRASFRHAFKYRYAFTHEHFVFVVATMSPRESRNPVTTRLIRFCRNDTKFVSYSEIELQCRSSDNTNYPHLTSAVQSGDKLVASFSSNSRKSSICVFSMQRIKLTFWYNVDRCRSGSDSIKLPHIGRDAKCVNKAHIPLDEDSCELGVGGSIELVEMSIKDIFANITSLLAIDQKAIFAGTSESQIVLMKWDDQKLEEYGRKDVGDDRTGSQIVQMKRTGDHVIVQMPYGIVLEEISTCSHHTTCTECSISVDPLCEWCHPTQSCTTSSRCEVPVSTVCPILDGQPAPKIIPVNTKSSISFNIRHLPPPNGFYYQCQFGENLQTSRAEWTTSGLKCSPVAIRDPMTIEISLLTSLSRNPIIRHNLTIYDCSQYEICSQCVSSEWSCEWCSGSHTCNPRNTCSSDKASACVRLHPLQFPIAVGSQSEIRLDAVNLETIDKNKEYFCKMNISGTQLRSVARIQSNSIHCSRLEFPAKLDLAPNLVVPLAVATNDQIIDITNVSLYSCSSMAFDCSSCLALSPSLSCGWCNGKCTHGCRISKQSTVCEPPRITKFEPTSGPIEGGTLVRISGTDLGVSIEDVSGKIFVAGSRCDLVEYHVSTMIACRVEKGTSSGPIKVSVGRKTMLVAESAGFYSFVKISIFSAYPLYGPVSGGTRVVLYGQHLTSGSNISISIGGKPCAVVKHNSTSEITCISPAGHQIGKSSRVVVSIDQATVMLDQPFEYRPDPTINNIHPLASFKAGGRTVSVQGRHFDSIISAKMFLLSSPTPPFEIVSELSACHVTNSTLLTCHTPKILTSVTRRMEFTRLPIGFAMDNVTSVWNLGRRLQMSIYPNPQLRPFKGVRYHQGEQPLILEGHNLNLAAEPNDFKIFIGSERCYVTLVDVKQLVCSGPVQQPKPTNEHGTLIDAHHPLVTVHVGTLRSELGLVQYADHSLTARLTYIIMTFVVVFGAGLCVVCAVWRKRRSEREKEYRKIQIQMENLENNVRKECKQAFAELQTNLVLSPTSNHITPEFLEFPHFVENLLWSEQTLASAPSLTRTLPVTLAQFHTLLSFKSFIFTVVESAESDVSISTSERSILASLLISVLLRNFSYCTEIVVDLLRAHIAKAVHNKRAEFLFRNSDSVVEKMFSKWMSICLYSHISPQLNRFFCLYKALQIQSEKGPIDAVTGDARYTINESRLLRESVDTTTLTLFVAPVDGSDHPVEIEVHACDAICQVKQKIVDIVYKDTPYSIRPKLSHIELKYKHPNQGELRLLDIPENELAQKGPIKLLTISDYGLISGSVLHIIPSNYTGNCYRNSIADSGQSSWSSLDRCSPIYSSSKFFHLTNPMSTFRKHQSIPKSIPEVYLTRLLTSKGTVQKYVDDFLESVLYSNDSNFPPILKYFFDLLDREAAINGVSENICQQWKANAYILRVWANFVRNPQLIFDVPPSISMDGNLSTVAQTLMDCFSFSEPVLGAHSPSSRLLFAKDVAKLRPLSIDVLRRVKNASPLTMDDLRVELVNIANDVSTCKGSSLALSELLSWVRGNGIRVTQLLSTNEEACENRLSQKLSQVLNVCLDPDNHIYSTISDYE